MRIQFTDDEGDFMTAEVLFTYEVIVWNHSQGEGRRLTVPYWPGHKLPLKSFIIQEITNEHFTWDPICTSLLKYERIPAFDFGEQMDLEF